MGFRLDEVRALLRLADDPVGSCEAAHDLACRHLTEVRAKISDLKAMVRALSTAIENPQARVVAGGGELTQAVNHALCQVEDWQEWIESNLPTVEKYYPGMKAPEAWVVIGRDHDLDEAAKVRIARRNINMRGRVMIRTYDDLIRDARAYARNIAAALRQPS